MAYILKPVVSISGNLIRDHRMTHKVTEEDWNAYLAAKDAGKSPECVGTIYAKDITGPGWYYLKGSDPNPPYYDVRVRIDTTKIPEGAIKWCRENGAEALKDLQDEEVWEMCKDAYYSDI